MAHWRNSTSLEPKIEAERMWKRAQKNTLGLSGELKVDSPVGGKFGTVVGWTLQQNSGCNLKAF